MFLPDESIAVWFGAILMLWLGLWALYPRFKQWREVRRIKRTYFPRYYLGPH